MSSDDINRMKADLGRMLAELREAQGCTQQDLIAVRQVHTSRSSIANVETGRQFPGEPFWTECDQALDAGGALLAEYRKVAAVIRERKRIERVAAPRRLDRAPVPQSRAALPQQRVHYQGERPVQARAAHRLQGAQLDAAIAHLASQWHALVRTDNLFGPRHAIASVHQQLSILNSLVEYAAGRPRREALSLAAKYAESAAWLHEDTADMRAAQHWTRQALEWATEAGDHAMVSWVMFRRSQQATTIGNAAQAVSFALAAQRHEGLGGPALAAALQQEAHGYALAGNERACHQRLDAAHVSAAPMDTDRDGRTGHGDFCTSTYIEVQRANCWLMLRRPHLAVPILEQAMTQIPDAYRRDRAQAQVRLARAYAALGQYDGAAALSASTLRIAREAGSDRTLGEAVSSARSVVAACDTSAASDLLDLLADVDGP
jgi:tetratricopeptide (TPR) repeat protein